VSACPLQSDDKFFGLIAGHLTERLRTFERFHDLQTRPQSMRHHVLQLLNELMANRRKGQLCIAMIYGYG